jgi:hypothetical protein
MKKNKIFLGICFVSIAMVFMPSSAYSQDVERHIIFLVDFSGSVQNNLDNYWKTISLVTGCSPETSVKKSKICNQIRPKDKITMIKITGQSRRKTDIFADIYLEKKGMLENKLKYNNKTIPIKTRFRDEITEAFTDPTLAKNTEILSAVMLAQQYFDTIKANKKILIILSDMIEESAEYNFKKRKIFPKQILERENEAKRLPNMDGVRVYISGASANTDKKFDEVKNFWIAYFNSVGATLLERDYCSSELLSFSE